MSVENHKLVLPGVAASALGQYLAVKLNPGVANQYILGATSLDDVFGLTIATSASALSDCAVVFEGVAKAIAAASLGRGAIVAVGSSNGALGPISASGVATGAVAAVLPKFALGRAMENAAAGQVFAVALDRREIF